MDKETHKKLTANFPKSVVKKAPQGKFGDYVPHHIYTKRLVDVVGGKYNFTYDIIRDKDNAVVGAKCTLDIDGLGTVQEVGDVDRHALARNLTESEILKLAVSDGIKRCCMRFGIGLELWTGETTEEEHYASSTVEEPKKKVTQETGTSPSKPRITENSLKDMVFVSCKEDKEFAKRCYNDCFNRTVIKVNKQTLEQWDDDDIGTFLDLVDEYITKHGDTFEERQNNEPIVNKIIENLDEVQDISEKEKDVDFTNDDWKKGREEEPMTDAQQGFLEGLIKQAIDKGLDELASEAKQYLNSGNTSKVTCSDWINKLKNAL
mgnify:FL=1|tara:strand:- start:3 stop:959 length:957 start_codon:yes stop_codon:yes gene_type:complete